MNHRPPRDPRGLMAVVPPPIRNASVLGASVFGRSMTRRVQRRGWVLSGSCPAIQMHGEKATFRRVDSCTCRCEGGRRLSHRRIRPRAFTRLPRGTRIGVPLSGGSCAEGMHTGRMMFVTIAGRMYVSGSCP
jgi:hypothetical protein